MRLTHLSLFSGIGGIDLAAEWAGFTTVGFVERDSFCQKILAKHWPGVPMWGDVKDVTAKSLATAGIGPVDLISGGFPCQPFSVAGQRRGKDDDRYLWPEMFRIIQEIRPAWVLGENVAGFVNMGLDTAVIDLEGEDYEVEAFIIPACGVGAPHQRYRVFIVANSQRPERRPGKSSGNEPNRKDARWTEEAGGLGASGKNGGTWDVADTERQRLSKRQRQTGQRPHSATSGSGWWAIEPDVGRVANGIPNRVDRIKALGNTVMPQQIYPVLQIIADIELRCEATC